MLITPQTDLIYPVFKPTLILAGSIEMMHTELFQLHLKDEIVTQICFNEKQWLLLQLQFYKTSSSVTFIKQQKNNSHI